MAAEARVALPPKQAPPFGLRTVVQGVMDDETLNLTDFGDIADEVFRRLPKSAREAALQQALRAFVRQVASERRASLTIAPPVLPAGSAPRSAKGAAIRAWSQQLRLLITTETGQKMLGACTYEDLMFAAQTRRDLASQNRAKAAQYERLAALLTEHNVKTVEDLPPAVLRSYLEAA